MDTRIYVMTHKSIDPIENDIYIPLHVGRKDKENLGYQGDDTGDSISEKNSNYCELTGLYWIWKNVTCDIVGICHYRRFFVKEDQLLEKEYIEQRMQQYSIIIPDTRTTKEGSVEQHYEEKHHIEDLLLCGEIIKEKYPEYEMAFEVALKSNLVSGGNMWITRKEIFDGYCAWLFDILFEAEKRINFTKYDPYQNRVMGFLSERLFRVWLFMQKELIWEEYVKMIEPKDFLNDAKAARLKYQYVSTNLKPLVQFYQSNLNSEKSLAEKLIQKDDFEGKIPVWVCWWQGEDEAPELVKMCLNSIKKNVPPEKAVFRLITFENWREYVTFTDAVLKKFQEGKIPLAHFADILRAELLYRYGGMWVDATYYVSGKLREEIFEEEVFWTLKFPRCIWKSAIPQERLFCDLLKVPAGNLFARFLMEAFWYYWETNDSLIDYFLIDYIAALSYDTFPEVQQNIESCQESDGAVFELQKNLNKKFDEKKYQNWKEKTQFFKLNWRTECVYKTLTQDTTFYGELQEK